MSLWAFLVDDSGDMVERGLILAAIVVVAIALWNTMGERLAAQLNRVVGAIG